MELWVWVGAAPWHHLPMPQAGVLLGAGDSLWIYNDAFLFSLTILSPPSIPIPGENLPSELKGMKRGVFLNGRGKVLYK